MARRDVDVSVQFMSLARITVIAAGAAVAAAAPAAAQSPLWPATPRTIVSVTDRDIGLPTLAFTSQGHPLATAWLSEGNFVSPSTGSTRLYSANSSISPFSSRGSAVLVAAPAMYAAHQAAYLRMPGTSGTRSLAYPPKPVRLGASTASVTKGGVGTFQELTTRAKAPYGSIAATPGGDVAAAWIEQKGEDSILRLSLRKPSSSFGTPSTIVGDGVASNVKLAYAANGDLVVAFQRALRKGDTVTRGVYVRIKRRGKQIGPIQSLGPTRSFTAIAVAAASDGSAVVGWGTQDGGEEANLPWVVRAALLKRTASSFSSAQQLDPGERAERPAGDVVATIADGGAASIAWSAVAGSRSAPSNPVRVASAPAGGRFATPVTLANNGAASGIATSANGTVTAVWGLIGPAGSDPTTNQIFASIRRPGGAFGLPEAVSARGRAEFAQVAIDPASGRPAVLWVSGRNVVGPPLGNGFGSPTLNYAIRAAG